MRKTSPIKFLLIASKNAQAKTLSVVLIALTLGLAACNDDDANVSINNTNQGSAPQTWIATWAASPQTAPGLLDLPDAMAMQLNDQTLRMIARVSRGGNTARVRLDNTFGSMAVTVGAASIALHDEDAGIVDGTNTPLTFDGQSTVTLPAGGSMRSDAVAIDIADLDEVAVSLYLPQQTLTDNAHTLGRQTTYISEQGNFADADDDFPQSSTTTSRYYLSGIEVEADSNTKGIVTLGDSITDGYASTVDANARWPDILANRFFRDMKRRDLTVINAGISGNRVLNDGVGPYALSRLDRDVFDQPGAAFVVLLEGINDIGFSELGYQTVSANDIIQGYREIISRAHSNCLKVIGATVTPFRGADYFTEAGEQKRKALNAYIRDSGEFDAVIDFEAAVQDPNQPERMLPAYDSGDHLHPNDSGYEAMAQSVDVNLFDETRNCEMNEAA